MSAREMAPPTSGRWSMGAALIELDCPSCDARVWVPPAHLDGRQLQCHLCLRRSVKPEVLGVGE